MSDTTNICLSCGICCDGTLIGFVQLVQEEIPRVKEFMEIEEEGGQGFFLHPCSKFCGSCTIYADRPSNCDKFNCKLLKSVEQQEKEFDAAVELVEVVKQKKLALEKKLTILDIDLESPSFYFKMIELKKQLQKMQFEDALTQGHLELSSNLNALDSLVHKEFGVSFD
jgi:hypothetical protein